MNQHARFPYLPVVSKRGESILMPLLPLELQRGEGQPVLGQGLLDSGATVNVMAFSLGRRLVFVWENQKTVGTLTGNLAAYKARAVLVEDRIAAFKPVPLVFAWAREDDVPLLVGQVNFFQEFDVCFFGARRQFEVKLAHD